MAEMTPQQQNLLRYLVPLLQAKESAQAAVGPSALGTVLDMILPSSQTVEKMSYGDMPFRMPTQSRIPITTDKQYLADLIGVAGALTPAAKPVQRGVQQLVREIQTTAPRGQVKLPQQPVMQVVAPKAPPVSGLLEPVKSDIGFYSQLEAATIPLQNKGTGAQYLAQISKTQGVKPEELQWTGLDEFLKSKQSVTKAEIQDYLNANRVDVQEVQLGQNNAYTEWNKRLDQAKRSQESAKINMELTLPDLSPVNYYNLRDMWAGQAARGDQEALSKIRSLGLTPEQEANVLDYGRQVSLVSELKGSAPPNLNPQFSRFTLPGGENYREILLTLPTKQLTEAEARVVLGAAPDAKLSSADIAYASRKNVDEYRSSHFDQPNILAHMRVNDRVVDGKKTLFIEEVQSDWHQAGRKKGYKNTSGLSSQQIADQQADIFRRFDAGQITREQRNAEIDALNEAKENLQAVPDAPFKTSWHELALKRAIQEASEKGYDQIAFTTGKTQAERYDLSKQVGEISVGLMGDQRMVKIKDPSGKTIDSLMVGPNGMVSESDIGAAGKSLDDVIGKELASKITSLNEPQVLRGLDLQVGGEGMKGFYDNILPKSLEKLGKKFDAKVTKSRLPSAQNKDDLTEKVYGRGEMYYRLPNELKSKIDQMYLENSIEVWTMDITPKMRESVTTKGQPLFAVPAIGAGLLGASMYQDEPMY